jgi:hypothetical protein
VDRHGVAAVRPQALILAVLVAGVTLVAGVPEAIGNEASTSRFC